MKLKNFKLLELKLELELRVGLSLGMKKITVIGAGNVGATTAQKLVEKELAEEIILLDVLEGIPQGKALDILQSSPVESFNSKIRGTNNYIDTKNSDLIVITAGLARKPGMSRDDLLFANADIVKSVTEKSVEQSPQAIIIVVSNPLDVMAYVAFKVSGFERHRVIGMAGILDTSRFRTFVAAELDISVNDIDAMVLGGHGDSMVPLVRYTTVSGIPLPEFLNKEKIEKLVDRTRKGGIEIVNYLKTGSAYYAPSSASVEMVEAIVKNKKRILPCSIFLKGEYGLENVFCGVPIRLGGGGVLNVIELKLLPEELSALRKSAEEVKANIKKLKI